MQRVELVEYQNVRLRSERPTQSDLDLAGWLQGRGESTRLTVQWLVDGIVDIRATSWVGVVRFSRFEIRIMPKLIGGALNVLRMIEYSDGVRLLSHLPEDQRLSTEGHELIELVVRALLAETQVLIRDGLMRDYRPTQDTLPVLRGRLRIRDQLLRRRGQLDKLECSFDEYDGDIPENQLLAAALTLAANRVTNVELKADVRLYADVLRQVCEPVTYDPSWYVRRIQYGRRNHRYQSAHHLALLVLRGAAVTDLHTTALSGVNAFLLNMNALFEQFFSKLVSSALRGTGLNVSSQWSTRDVIRDETTGTSYARIRPDLLIVDPACGRAVPVDVKYKLYDSRKIDSADIYQLFTYGYALGHKNAENIAGVVYPATAQISGPRLRISPRTGFEGARVCAAGIDVATILRLIEDGQHRQMELLMRDLIGEVTGLDIPVPLNER